MMHSSPTDRRAAAPSQSRLRAVLLCSAAAAFLSACDTAPLGGGASTTVGLGATSNDLQDDALSGTVVRDEIAPFAATFSGAGSGSQDITVAGEVQDRVVSLEEDGTLVFAPRLRNMTSTPADNTIALIESFTLTGYRGVDVEVFYRSDGAGRVAPATVTRSPDGDRLTFTFSLMEDRTTLASIQGADFPDTHFMSIKTDATEFTTGGTMSLETVVQSFNGRSEQTIDLDVAIPVRP
jgi:hypothetical protein